MPKHDYATTQIDMPPDIRGRAVLFAGKIPANELASDGIEFDTHITVKYGLSDEALEQAKSIISEFHAFPVRLGTLSLFKKEDTDVLKVGIISPELERLHYALGELPNSEEKRPYSPHLTLAYLKPGEGDKYEGLDGPFLGESLWVRSITFGDTNGVKHRIPLREHEVYKEDREPFTLDNPEIDTFLLRYQGRINELVKQAQSGLLTREQFSEKLRSITESAIAIAFLIPGGNPEIEGYQENMADITDNLTRGIENYTNDVFGGTYDNDPGGIVYRSAIWATTVAGAYTLGQMFNRNVNQRYTWKLGRTVHHCRDCKGFDGQTKTAAEWYQTGLWPQSRALECKGYNCDCSFQRVAEKEVLKHLGGKHDQATHGHGGGNGGALSKDEVASITHYTGSGYVAINGGLRAAKGGSVPDGISRHVKNMDSAIGKGKTTEDAVVYRGMRNMKLPDKKTFSFTDHGYASASGKRTFAEDWSELGGRVVARIRVPKGQKGLWLKERGIGNEDEFLFPRGTRFRVYKTGEARGYTVLYMDVLP